MFASAVFGCLLAMCLILFMLTANNLSAQLIFLDLQFCLYFVMRLILYMILCQFSPGFTIKSQVNHALQMEMVGMNMNDDEIFRYIVLPDPDENKNRLSNRSSNSVKVQNKSLGKTLMRADSNLSYLSEDEN